MFLYNQTKGENPKGDFMLNLKKIVQLLAVLALTSPLFIEVALANNNLGGGFTGTGPSLSTIAEAIKMPDESYVTLQGNIIRYNGDEKYTFKDSSGEHIVEIDDDIWRGLHVNAQNVVELLVEVEKEWNFVELEVAKVTIIN